MRVVVLVHIKVDIDRIGMNAKHLVTSLSQQLDTSCADFPDGFEETQQLQVSKIHFYVHFSHFQGFKTMKRTTSQVQQNEEMDLLPDNC